MSTVIDATAVAVAGVRHRHSALHLAEDAGRRALAACGQRPADVDLLINAGLYHDRNLGEPALAPLIQEDLHTTATADPVPGSVGTFSFDMADGTCGVLDALEVADGFLRAGTARTALVVASDADPGHGLAPAFPFQPAGGALVCHRGDDGAGLGPVAWADRFDGGDSFRSTVRPRAGHNVLEVVELPAAGDLMAEAAAAAAADVLAASALEPAAVDLWVVAPGEERISRRLVASLGIHPSRIVAAPAGVHTAGLVFALDSARDRLAGALTVLVAAGAGVTAGAAVYRHPAGPSGPMPHRR